MAEKLIWDATVRAVGGPQLNSSGEITVDAYDKVSVVIPERKELAVDLGTGARGKIACLVILPEVLDEKLSYKVGNDKIKLNQPQFLLGGAVDLAGNPASLVFKNELGQKVTVSILIGRDATPTA